MSARVISIVLGLVLIAMAVLTVVPQQFIGAAKTFEADGVHAGLFGIAGLLLLILPSIIGGKQSLLLMGVIFAAISVLGVLHAGDPALISGLVTMNQADAYILHPAIAVVLLLAGLVFSNHSHADA